MFEGSEEARYEQLCASFQWELPSTFNIGRSCSDDQLSTRVALIDAPPGGGLREVTFGQLAEMSNRLANGLRGLGVVAGDRVGIVLPQGLETAVCHLAVYKLGAVAVPMTVLFGPDALRYRLGDSEAKVVIARDAELDRVVEAGSGLATQVVVAGDATTHTRYDDLVQQGAARIDATATEPDTPALLIYTSGTTGPPKGALHGHRVLLGHLPGFQLMYNFFGRVDDRMWTPADWAWIGGLLDAVLPSWYHGCPVVAAAGTGFDPEWAVEFISKHRIRNAFLPPTALKLMQRADVATDGKILRSCMSGGESLGDDLLAWSRENLYVTVNEIYGQTEANLVVGNCHVSWPVVPGSMGRPFPGHDVAVLDEDGVPVSGGEVGEIGVRSPDPVMFLRYWNQPEATAAKFRNSWLMTGDLASRDDEGYLWFHSRNDDVINSSGYRIGPGEIENCLVQHPLVVAAAVIGVSDELRGEAVKAYVQLDDRADATPALAEEISKFVRGRLSAHSYPRQIEFIAEIPMTTTGKVRRVSLRNTDSNARRS